MGIALFDARELRLLAANPSYQSFLELVWQHGRAIGHPLTKVLTDVLHEAERSEVAAIFRRVAETGVAYHA